MDGPSPHLHDLLDGLLAEGDALLTALAAHDYGGACDAAERRRALVARLPAEGSPHVAPEHARALVEQDLRIARGLADAEARLDAALAEAAQRRQAGAAYHAPPPPRGSSTPSGADVLFFTPPLAPLRAAR